jgi:tetratricopeptide (TPR) repeat protein
VSALTDFLEDEGDIDSAIDLLEPLAARASDKAYPLYCRLALLYRISSSSEKAVESLSRALAVASKLQKPDCLINLAETFEFFGRNAQAVETYGTVARDPSFNAATRVKALLRIARLNESDNDWKEARAVYRDVLTFDVEEAKYAQERLSWITENITDN